MSGGAAPPILYLCTIWRRAVNFTGWPLLCQGKNPQFPLLGSAPEPFWAFLSTKISHHCGKPNPE